MQADAGVKLAALKVDGGACKNDFLMQFQADIIDAPVHRPQCVETTAMGAAYLAGLSVGFFKDEDEIKDNWQLDTTFESSISPSKRDSLLMGWKRAVRCTVSYTEE